MRNFSIKQILKKILFFLLFLNLLACHQPQKINIIKPTKLSFPLYGNYCGPLYPPKGSNPIPIDAVDNACKNHDLCYDYYGYLNQDCDNAIITELKYITPKTANEELMRKLLIIYFNNLAKF